ncbi:MAG: FecR domain-containing protein [Acidobacteria bacterium]|nr:FecR domain-containing protein [Acidobacteriota bacterium]
MNARISRRLLIASIGAVMLCSSMPPAALAQHLVSARAGLVNHAGPEVQLQMPGESSWIDVATHQQLEDGVQIRTGRNSRAELLLNPGSFLRMDRDTVVRAAQTDLSRMVFELRSGSAIVEAGGLEKIFTILVATPETLVRITKDGLYRVDLKPGVTELSIHKGSAMLQPIGASEKKVGDGKMARVTAGEVELSKLANIGRDEFDYWSQDRAETLIAANRSLMRRSGFAYGLSSNGWYYDPLFAFYTFVPFGSPYYSPYFNNYGYWCGGYFGGYVGGGWAGPSVPQVSGKPNGEPYRISLKDPGQPIRVATSSWLDMGGGRYSSQPVYSAASRGGSAGGGAMTIPSSAPVFTGTAMAPAGKGRP